MEYIVENKISQDTIDQVYSIARDYTKDYFTNDYPDNMKIDMLFHRAVLLKNGVEIIACIVFTCLDGSPHITLMATKRAHNNNGYGKLLMKFFVNHVSEIGLNSIELYTFSPQTKPIYAFTVGFYEKAGFKIVGEYKDLWGTGTITLKMKKIGN